MPHIPDASHKLEPNYLLFYVAIHSGDGVELHKSGDDGGSTPLFECAEEFYYLLYRIERDEEVEFDSTEIDRLRVGCDSLVLHFWWAGNTPLFFLVIRVV